MFGVHSFNRNQPFVILQTDYYETAFAGMLKWEPDMSRTLLSLFGNAKLGNSLSKRTWADLTTKNKDLRVLYNFDGSIALVYMFKDTNTVIISTNTDTLFKISDAFDLVKEKVQ